MGDVVGPSERVYEGGQVRIGRFRCRPQNPEFGDTGPTRGHLVVFPRETVTITHAGGRPIVADPTCVMFYNLGQEYRREAITPAGDRCEWFAFPTDAVEAAMRAHGGRVPDAERPFGGLTHGPSDAGDYLRQRRLFQRVVGGERPDPFWVEETALSLLDRAVGRALAVSGATASRDVVHRDLAEATKAFLATRFAEALSLREVADAVGASPFHLARVFRRQTGRSVHGFRTQLRLRAALDRMVGGGGDLIHIALEVGFSSHSHFTAAFRAVFGAVPSAVRDRARS
jgi:AraC family transcriptional regulator